MVDWDPHAMFQRVGTPNQIMHQDFADDMEKVRPLTKARSHVINGIPSRPGQHLEDIWSYEAAEREKLDEFYRTPTLRPEEYGVRARVAAQRLVGALYSIYGQVKGGVERLQSEVLPGARKLVAEGVVEKCALQIPPKEPGGLRGEFDALVEKLGVEEESGDNGTAVALNAGVSELQNLRRLRILDAVRQIQRYAQNWDPDDEDFEQVRAALRLVDSADLRGIQKLEFALPDAQEVVKAGKAGKRLTDAQVVGLNLGRKKERDALFGARMTEVWTELQKLIVRPYDDKCRGPLLSAYDDLLKTAQESAQLLQKVQNAYDQAELARHGVLDVVGLAPPRVPIEIDRKTGFLYPKSRTLDLGGGTGTSTVPEMQGNKSGKPRMDNLLSASVPPQDMDVEYSVGAPNPYAETAEQFRAHDDPFGLEQRYWHPLDPFRLPSSQQQERELIARARFDQELRSQPISRNISEGTRGV
eukprot:g4140.t1